MATEATSKGILAEMDSDIVESLRPADRKLIEKVPHEQSSHSTLDKITANTDRWHDTLAAISDPHSPLSIVACEMFHAINELSCEFAELRVRHDKLMGKLLSVSIRPEIERFNFRSRFPVYAVTE